MKLSLKQAITLATKQNKKMQDLINNTPLNNDIYTNVVRAHLQIVMEHHKAICELIVTSQLSALTLVRPLFEEYIKTLWLVTCEGQENVDKAIVGLLERNDNNSFPQIRLMCEELDIKISALNQVDNRNVLSKHWERNKDVLHSYTHGGSYLVSLIINKKDLFTQKDILSILESTTGDMLSSAQSYAVKIRDLPLSQKIYIKTDNFYKNFKK